jgi:toxin CcdB
MTIRQFDVVSNPTRSGKGRIPFLINLQHHHLDHLKTRLVAGLISGLPCEPSRLNPMFNIDGNDVFFDPTDIAAIDMRFLKNPVANLASDTFRITAALDLVFTGV